MTTIFCAEWRTEPKIAYYRGAMGLLLVYHVTDDSFFNNILNWIRNIEQHASANVKKVLVGNKADMNEGKRDVPTSWVQAFADEYGIKFFETRAKTNLNVVEVYFFIAQDIKQRLSDSDSKSEETQHSELEDLFPEYGKVVHADMKKGYAFVNFEEQLDGTSFASEFNKCIVDWATELDAIHDWGREIIFDTKCKSYTPPSPFISEPSHPIDTADLNNMPDNNRGGSDGSSSPDGGGKNASGSHGSSGSNPIPNRTLFVANFDPILTKCHDIKTHFEPYGKVLSVRINPEYAFVHFKTQEDVTKALECTHLSTLFDRLLCVGYATRGDNEKGRCDGPPNPRAMSPDPPRASPVNDGCDGPPNSRAMSPDPARANTVRDIEARFYSNQPAPSPLNIGSHNDHVQDTVDQTTDGDRNGDGSSSDDGSDDDDSSDDGSDDDDSSDDSDDGGVEGIHGFEIEITLESDEVLFTSRNACKLFGVNPEHRSHIITVLPQEEHFEVILLGEGFFTFELIDGRSVLTDWAWNYRVKDKRVPDDVLFRPPSWHEEALWQVYVCNATKAVFRNHNGHVSVLFHNPS